MSSTESRHRPANRLAGSTSPYLLQHAHNPVDWYPWGEEALARARAEDKPIFLSIGYAACHWCHVMERESFENEQIAALLNAHFVAIKVDREERPDLDDLYMQAVQLMTGQGGWPMSVFLTPEGIPFFGGTYFPPEDHFQRIGFGRLLARIHELWQTDRAKVLEQGTALAEAIRDSSSVLGVPGELGWSLIERATTQLGQRYDSRDGGFGGAPKFPPSMAIALLLREYRRRGEPTLLEMAEHTLQAMARGGMYDQLAGGFHRYSTDAQWLVPHFEKMLYDNALLAPVYFDAARLTGNAWYASIGREVLDWVLGEMTDRSGGFYSTLDADSEGVEGKFFTWRPEEVQAALGAAGFAAEAIALFEECYDVTGHGNWHEAYAGGSILHLSESVEAFASRKGLDAAVLGPQLRSMRAALLAARAARVRPGLDDKILTNWNALMISALCSGAQYFGEKRYAQAARAAAEFIWRQMRSESADGAELLHASRAGRAHIAGFLEDYAYLLNAMLDLYETEFRAEDLERATWLGEQTVARFHDAEAGGFFTSDGRDPSVIARLKDFYDGATPSGNSMAVRGLLRLSPLLDRADLRNAALDTLAALAGQMEHMPPAHHLMLSTLADHLSPMRELAIVGRRGGDEATRVKRLLGSQYLPARVIAWAEDDEAAAASNVALLRGKQIAAGHPISIYVCQNFACAAPVHTAAELAQLLKP